MGVANKNSIMDFLLQHAKSEPVSFHMPGHKGSRLYRKTGYGEFLERLMDCDITEIEGADNLFQPESIIKNSMDRYGKLYNAKKSYLLVNGTSCGLISAVMGSVEKGGKLIMARNCHKSVFNALTLGNITPVYVYPEIIEELGISGEVSPNEIERLLEENPEAGAVILPSPNYYGICSDIEKIAEVVHRAGKILIVDQAHGAHLNFFEEIKAEEQGRRRSKEQRFMKLPKSSESLGADIVVNSIHKTLASFTQSAVMNVVTDRVDLDLLEDKLQAIESTSPSYLLMASLDINADMMETQGLTLMEEWYDCIEFFYEEAKNIDGLSLMNSPKNMDFTKINLDMSRCSVSGHELEKILMEANIFPELVTGDIVMCMSGIGNEKQDYRRLLEVLRGISSERFGKSAVKKEKYDFAELAKAVPKSESANKSPKGREKISIDDAKGRVCAVSIVPYPPGIPLLCPGEIISLEAVSYVKALREAGEKVMGIDEKNMITVEIL